MKFTKAFVILSILFTSISCSKEEENFKETDLIGNWKISMIEYSGTISASAQDLTEVSNIEVSYLPTFDDYNITFAYDPNGYRSENEYFLETITTSEDGRRRISIDATDKIFQGINGDWTIEGDELLSTVDGETTAYPLISVDRWTLVFDMTRKISGEESGLRIDIDVTGRMELKKQ